MRTLSTNAHTGQPMIDGQPATPEQVRAILREGGGWWQGQYTTDSLTVSLGEEYAELEPVNGKGVSPTSAPVSREWRVTNENEG